MASIGIGLKDDAFTPEAYAYANFLEAKGFLVQLEAEAYLNPDNDVNIFFMGVDPLWSRRRGSAKIIHEYHSLSVGPFAKLKDSVKKVINKKPDARIFLNKNVSEIMAFKDSVPHIYRDMGVKRRFCKEGHARKKYDLIYCGSYRAGLDDVIFKLLSIGLKLLIVGVESKFLPQSISSSNKDNLVVMGRVSPLEIDDLYSQARAGLNFTPNVYPFNFQTSTKTLEYLAAGLGLVSNRYPWVESFCYERNVRPLWLEDITRFADFENIYFPSVDMSEFTWDTLLEKSGIERLIRNLL